jgi:hypothetical protein
MRAWLLFVAACAAAPRPVAIANHPVVRPDVEWFTGVDPSGSIVVFATVGERVVALGPGGHRPDACAPKPRHRFACGDAHVFFEASFDLGAIVLTRHEMRPSGEDITKLVRIRHGRGR